MSFKTNKIRFAKIDRDTITAQQELLNRVEKMQAKRMIQQFASFLPDEILRFRGSAKHMELHRHFVGVLLAIDVSRISQLIDRHYNGESSELYKLKVHLNAYIGCIIEVLRWYGGDVLGIFGNYCVTMWKVLPDESIQEILHTVIVCASVLQRNLATYHTDVRLRLHLKTVISCGNISYGIFGNYNVKKAVFIGDALNSLQPLMVAAEFNQVVVSNNSYPHMLHDRYTVVESEDGYVTVTKISYSSREGTKKTFFDEKYLHVVRLIKEHYQQKDALENLLQSSKLLANVKINSNFMKALPPRQELALASHYWTVSDMQPLQDEVVFGQLSDSQTVDYLTEMKEITCLYIKIVAAVDNSAALLEVVDDVFLTLVEETKTMHCTIQHVNVLDISIMVRILFGLMVNNRKSESDSALQLARRMKKLLGEKEHVINVSAGVSSGNVFCSVIGHPLRREYAVIGNAVPKALRLALLAPDKVLCDLKVFKSVKLSALYFKLFKEETCENGEIDSIIEYDESLDNTEEEATLYPLIDRVGDVNFAVAMIQDPHTVGFSGICFQASDKLGKSTLLLHLRDECASQNCTTVFVTLIELLKRPYYTVSEIYRQIYNQVYTVHADIQNFLDLPRHLHSFNESANTNEDIAIQKYRTLNCFRDMVAYVTNTIVVFIDNVHFIDVQSWEIIELTFPMDHFRMVMSCSPSVMPSSFLDRLENNANIRIKELLPLKTRYMAPLTCSLLQAQAVSHRLIYLLTASCNGSPGKLQCLLLRLLNNGTIKIHYVPRNKFNPKQYYSKPIDESKDVSTVFAIVDFSSHTAIKTTRIEMDDIYNDCFDSMPTFLQLVVKTAALIGAQFGRQLLRLALNLPAENDLAQAIQNLFENKIIVCTSVIVSQEPYNPSAICCRCHFDETFVSDSNLPKYAHCKLMQFTCEKFRNAAYNRLPADQRHELHVLCAEVLEKTTHICPSCMRNPSNYYAFLGHYDDFLEFCINPKTAQNYYMYAKDSNANVKQAILEHSARYKLEPPEEKNIDLDTNESIVLDEKYTPLKRHYDSSACYCLDMLHVIYQELIMHSSRANETGKMIFYKLKFGLNQMCMRDIAGAIKTLHETRELSLVNCGLKEDQLTNVFRKYHVGKASIGLAICNLKIKNVAAAKSNIMLALRQYHIPLMAFSFRHMRFLLRRSHLKLKTLRPYSKQNDAFGWELGCALFICAKVYALENNWGIAKDCCKCGISLMKASNNNIAMMLDTYSDAIQIYSVSGDNQGCERLQKYIVREFQTHYAQNDAFSFHMLLDMLNIVLEVSIATGRLNQSLGLGYRFVNLADQSKVLKINPSVLLLLCELNLYNLSFGNFIDLLILLNRHLSHYHKNKALYYYLMCMHCYNYTGFHVRSFQEILKFANDYFRNSFHEMSLSEKTLKLLIQIHLLRCKRYERASAWEAEMYFENTVRSSCKIIKLMLFQLEAYLLQLLRVITLSNNDAEDALNKKIRQVKRLLKKAVAQNAMYRPAFCGLNAWHLMLQRKKSSAFRELARMHALAEKCKNPYFQALALRVKNHWEGGFLLEFESRPSVSIREATTYTFGQFAQFLHSYVLS